MIVTSKHAAILTKYKNRFRGRVSALKSRRFVKSRTRSPVVIFRSGLRELLLDARAYIHPNYYEDFIEWINSQINAGLAEYLNKAIGYDELAGIYTRAPVVDFDRELLWVTIRIKSHADKLNDFISSAMAVENLALTGKAEEAIEKLQQIENGYGASLWSVQLRVALENLAGGLERQKRYSAEIRRVFKRGLLGFIAYYTSVRNEEKTTLSKYSEDIQSRIDKHQYYEPFVKAYATYKLLQELPDTEGGLADIMRAEQSHSLIDIYETYIRVAQELAKNERFTEKHELLKLCMNSLSNIDDYRIGKILIAIGSSYDTAETRKRDVNISDCLFAGDLKNATRNAIKYLNNPDHIDVWQYIYAGAAYSHYKRNDDKAPVAPGDIPKAIGKILGRSNAGVESLAQLEKMVVNLGGLPIAIGIADLLQLLRRKRPDDPWRPWLIGLNSRTFGVEDIPPGNYEPYLSYAIRKGQSIDLTTMTWGCLHGRKPELLETKNEVLSIFSAVSLISNGEYQQAASSLSFIDGGDIAEPLRSLSVNVLLNSYYCMGDRQKVIQIVADEGSRGDVYVQFLPVCGSLEHYVWRDYKDVSEPLSAPIALHLLWSSNGSDTTASLLKFATRETIKKTGVRVPSELVEYGEGYTKRHLVYFLHHVCVPQVLDSSRVLKGSRDVLEERIAICSRLREVDKINSEMYQDEMISISNQLALEEGQWIVDRTRVHVDTESLSRWATKEFSEDFSRYRELLTVNVDEEQSFDDVIKELMTQAPSRSINITPDNEADAILVSIFSRCGDEFLNNPNFGFDFYLSKRIRHQSFIGLIRGPLEFNELITTKESETGSYHRNTLWINKFETIDMPSKEALNDALNRFSSRFDELLINAKDAKFHLKTNERPHGLLFLDLTPQFMAIVRAVVGADTTLQEFISIIISLLWVALEPSLNIVRHYITDDLKPKIAQTFDELRANVRRIAEHDPAILEFDIAVGNCSYDVQRALDDVSTWFTHKDIEVGKKYYTLEQIVNIAIDAVLKCFRTFEPNISRNIAGNYELPANNLVFVHDVLFVAIDNARNHSGIKKPMVEVTVEVDADIGTLSVEVLSESRSHNKKAQEDALQDIRQLIAVGNVGRRTRSEGRSGILKLAAVVNQSKKGKIEFGFTEDEQFRLKVTYSWIMLAESQSDKINEQ